MRIRTLHAAAAAALVLALVGCVDSDPLPTLPPTPTATPIFASEEEALAAAEAAYAAYSEVSSRIAIEGGVNPERIAPFVTDEQLQYELETAQYYRDNEVHASAAPVNTKFTLQRFGDSDLGAEVVVYVCVDVAHVSVLDAEGVDVTPADRPSLVTLEVTLVGPSRTALLVAETEVWPDTSHC